MKNHWPAEAVAEHVHEAVQEFKPNKVQFLFIYAIAVL